jgi:hypothetical protein
MVLLSQPTGDPRSEPMLGRNSKMRTKMEQLTIVMAYDYTGYLVVNGTYKYPFLTMPY